jgi:DNA-binding PadR family transcriptional regulator
VKSDPDADLLPGEWAVLAVIAQGPSHGFAVWRKLEPGGEIGRVWSMTRPRVYRAIDDLAACGLIAAVAEAKGGRGPTRSIYRVTDDGRARVSAWLATPVEHVREVRSDLLLKLAFVHAAGESLAPLLAAQEAQLLPLLERVERAREAAEGFDAVVLSYRAASIRSVLDFVRANAVPLAASRVTARTR